MHGSILLYLLPPAPWDKSSPSVLGWGIFLRSPSFEVCHLSVRVYMMVSDHEEEDLQNKLFPGEISRTCLTADWLEKYTLSKL